MTVYRVEIVTATSRDHIISTPIREQAISGAKAAAKRTGKAVHVTRINHTGEREVKYMPDGSVVRLWAGEA